MTFIARRKLILTLICAVAGALAHDAPVSATPIGMDGFAIKISEDISSFGGLSQSLYNSLKLVSQDRPTISIRNTSSDASITAFSLSMGNSTFNFGSLLLGGQASSAVANASYPASTPGSHAGSSFASLTFNEFLPNQSFNFRLDIDRAADGGASLTNYRQALAGGPDSSQWAMANVTFSDGTTLHQLITPADISGAPQNASYSYFYCMKSVPPTGEISLQAQTAPVPEPGTWLLAAMGLAGLVAVKRRRAVAA